MIISELAKTLQNLQGALTTHSETVNENMGKTLTGMNALASAITTVQDQVEMLELRL